MFLLAPSLEIIVFILMYLLGAATDNENLSPFYENFFFMNLLVFFGLLFLVFWQFFKLKKRRKTNFFGNSLARKILIFALTLILIPGALFFTISTSFLTKSIDNRVIVETNQVVKNNELSLNQMNLSDGLVSLTQDVANTASYFSTLSTQQIQEEIMLTAESAQLTELTLFDDKGQVIAFADKSVNSSKNKLPLTTESLMLLKSKLFFEDVVLVDGQLVMRIFYSYVNKNQEMHILSGKKTITGAAIKKELLWGEQTLQGMYRDKLVNNYLNSFSLIFAISILGAISLALAFAEQLTSPLLRLSKTAEAIAHGDFSKQNKVTRRDELGSLTAIFNDMTIRLKAMHALAEKRQSELALSKQYVVSILTTLKSGVLTFDEEWFLLLNNQSAEKILGLSFADFNGVSLKEWPKLNPSLLDLIDLINQNSLTSHLKWQQQFAYSRNQGQRLLLIRGSRLKNQGYVIVFDDITELARAQRDAAWGEVAKRLAHEIRNPLMPIQLSAERLALKLSHKLEVSDAAMLIRSTNTIIKQVDALTGMVDAFRKYAKAPMANLSRISLTTLIKEVMVLYEDQSMMKLALIDHPLYIQGDENLLRQVFHNVLQNAQDTLNETVHPLVLIEGQIFQESIVICIKDNGQGFDESILAQAFEPYVTTKLKGTGLGLAMVKKIMEEHGGHVTLANWVDASPDSEMPATGAIVTLSWPLIA
jgi:nitrogen fixation/metabolism regulation signal transduction histidine kinase